MDTPHQDDPSPESTSEQNDPGAKWKKKEWRSAYNHHYHKLRPRVPITARLQAAFESLPESQRPRKISVFVLELAEEALSFREDPERPEPISHEQSDKIRFLFNNLANNVNQVARRLNFRAKEEHRRVVAGHSESVNIMEELFEMIYESKQRFLELAGGESEYDNSTSNTTP